METRSSKKLGEGLNGGAQGVDLGGRDGAQGLGSRVEERRGVYGVGLMGGTHGASDGTHHAGIIGGAQGSGFLAGGDRYLIERGGGAYVEKRKGDTLAKHQAMGGAYVEEGRSDALAMPQVMGETSDAYRALDGTSCTPGGAHDVPGSYSGTIQASIFEVSNMGGGQGAESLVPSGGDLDALDDVGGACEQVQQHLWALG
ncbi:unnamed protein product [Ilex paraguariensis]|uniref:Uncharacterized protein n=1 Tax=Ilex paraguariensis TaxID=185542 RepID=A0ABC8SSA6_9AQUA